METGLLYGALLAYSPTLLLLVWILLRRYPNDNGDNQ